MLSARSRFAFLMRGVASAFQYFYTAWRTLKGYEIMNAIPKGPVQNITKDDVLGQRKFVHSLFGITVLKNSYLQSFSVRLNFLQHNLCNYFL